MRAFVCLVSLCVALSVASAEPFVVIVRHAEKANNDPKDPDLSPSGHVRAEALARILKDAGITTILISEFKRTQQTAAPTSRSTGIAPTIVAGKDIGALVSKLRRLNGNALVVGHGNTIPDIIKALGIEPPIEIPDSDYSELFVVTIGAKPQLLHLHYP